MILEFSLENFRSIDKEQILSFYSTGSQGGSLGNTVLLPDVGCRIVKSVGFYGANASGKTNLLRALWSMRKIVKDSYNLSEEESIPWYEPCIFRKADLSKATRFTLEFMMPYEGGMSRFLYKLAYDDSEIVEESLTMFPKVRAALLFSRKRGDTKDTISLGASLKGGERRVPFFKNQAYLSVAGRNAAAPLVLRRVYRFFRERFTQIRLFENYTPVGFPSDMEASRLIRFVDVGVSRVERRVNDKDNVAIEFPSDIPIHVRRRIENQMKSKFIFTHKAGPGEVGEIELRDESDGTRRLFWLFPMVVDMLINGGVFVIDEIECGMHPLMAESIVRLFNDPEANTGRAQMLFTTHNSNLLSQDIMRRDQIWFTEKRNGRTHCYSLDDFDKKLVTPTSPYVKWYLEGRFGALPAIDFAGLVKAIVTMRDGRDANEEK